MAQALNNFWQHRTHSPRLTGLISCLQMQPLLCLFPILWYHHWGLGFLYQACLLLAPSQYCLLEPFHLRYTPAMPPPPMPPGAGGHGPPLAGTPGAGHPRHGHSHPHPHPLGGCPIQGGRCSWPHHGPHGLRNPHAGPPASGGQPPPRPPLGMPHPGPPPVGMPPQGPPFGSPMGHPGPMPLHGVHGPPPLMPSHRASTLALHDLHLTATSRDPLPPLRPTAQPPVPPQGPLGGPLPQ